MRRHPFPRLHRHGPSQFIDSDLAASEILEGYRHLFSIVYNVLGDVVLQCAEGRNWRNQALADQTFIEFAPDFELSNGDFFFQSFCGSYYEPAKQFGDGIGVVDDLWLNTDD